MYKILKIKIILGVIFYLIICQESYANPETLIDTSLNRVWKPAEIGLFPELASKYLIDQALDSEFYIYSEKNIGFLRLFLPFKSYKLMKNVKMPEVFKQK